MSKNLKPVLRPNTIYKIPLHKLKPYKPTLPQPSPSSPSQEPCRICQKSLTFVYLKSLSEETRADFLEITNQQVRIDI